MTTTYTPKSFRINQKRERNQRLYERYMTGKYTMRSLAKMFKISPARVHAIIKAIEKLMLSKGEN